MEEILASIKRIIAEDSDAVGRTPRTRRGPVAVPDPEPAAPDGAAHESVVHAFQPRASRNEAEAEASDVLELTSPLEEPVTAPVLPTQAAFPAAETVAPSSEPAVALRTEGGDGILSAATAVASRSAFAALAQLQVRPEPGQTSNTLEGLVTDMLRPMLREWLDRELPALVERLVAAEIQKVSGRG